jgi:phosphatidate cytidylyltransferase
MLRQRVVTAVLLLLVLLPSLFYPSPEPFCALTVIFIAAGAWEWSRLAGYRQGVSLAAGGICALACLAAWSGGLLHAHLQYLWAAAAVVWVLGGAWLLRGGPPAWLRLPKPVKLGGGMVLLVVAWLALAQARVIGINFLLSVMALVWVADIFAYGAGRTWGGRIVKRKLAPGISPGKSWEGVWGGMAGVLVLAFGWYFADTAWHPVSPSLYYYLAENGLWLMALATVWLASMSVVGDLVESLVKRAAAVKDSSGLLPGHGGVLDRIDALLPTLPLAMLLFSV